MRSRAFTMIELLITVALTAIVLVAIAGIFGFASMRLADSYTQTTLYDQLNGVADRIEATVRNADTCSIADGGATLTCGMPINGVDVNGDGYNDTYYPDQTDANGNAQYTVGSYVWFYPADSTGAYHPAGAASSGHVWRAERSNTGNPRSQDIDTSFAYYMGTMLRYPLVNSYTFSVNAPAHTVTFVLTGTTRIGAETSVGASDSSNSRTKSLTRTVKWRN